MLKEKTMSTKIPDTMLMSDLLKATGYDCPSTLAGKTFKQSTSGAGIDIETNKAVTLDVSQYTQPVEIDPSDTYEAMEKVTLSLSGIPTATKLFAFGTAEKVVYTTAIPSEAGTVDVYVPAVTGLTKTTGAYAEATGVTVSDVAYARYDTGDIQF